jgi:putative DNA primase/helicase
MADEDKQRENAWRRLQSIFRLIRHPNTGEGEREAAKGRAKQLMDKYGFGEPKDEARTGSGRRRTAETIIPHWSQPMAVARTFIGDRYSHDGVMTLRHWRGGWMKWCTTHWVEIEEPEVRSQLWKYTEHAVVPVMVKGVLVGLDPWLPNRFKIANLFDALKAVTHLAQEVNAPSWIDGATPLADQLVACKNGLLDIVTRKIYVHDPHYFNVVSVPFDYDAKAPKPRKWLKFLHELWPDEKDDDGHVKDNEPVKAAQEWFGYTLSGRTDLEKALLMVGPKRSGKGTIAHVLTHVMGEGNVVGPTLSALSTNFGMAPLIGRPLAIISDARLGPDTHQIVERLLTATGRDGIQIDRKYREAWNGPLPTRFMIISNELPAFSDASGAVVDRFVTLLLTVSWLGRENPKLKTELEGEAPAVLNWALDGLERLATTDRFTQPHNSAEAMAALHDLASPVAAFARDCCVTGKDGKGVIYEFNCDALYRVWKLWAEENGHKAGTSQVFGRNLRAVIPGLSVYRPRQKDGTQVRHYRGIRPHLTSDELELHALSRNSMRLKAATEVRRVRRSESRLSPM